MKRLFIAVLCVVTLAVSISPMADASSRKKVKKVKKTEEQKFAEDPNRTTVRAWASWNDFPTMNIEAIAAAEANAALAEQTARLVSRAIDKLDESKIASEKGVNSNAQSVRAASQEVKMKLSSDAKGIIKGSRVAMSSRYEEKDGTHTCYVAVEISVTDILNNIKNMGLIEDALGEDGESLEFNNHVNEQFEESKLDTSKL